jgi:hypothetical protein
LKLGNAGAALLSASLLLAGCLANGGSGTESENGELVAGRVYQQNGDPAVGAEVYVRRTDYLRDTSLADPIIDTARTRTDVKGTFRLHSLPPGAYTLEIRHGKDMAALHRFNLEDRSRWMNLESDTLRRVGVLEGGVELPEAEPFRAYIQVFGLNRLVRADLFGNYVIPDMPAGYHHIRAVSPLPRRAYLEPVPAVVTSGATTRTPAIKLTTFETEEYGLWPFSRKIYLDAGPYLRNGAGAAVTVVDFPLLVRLDESRFDFSLSEGKDIRFSGPDGKHLPYQIEQWDDSRKCAAIWIKLDSVAGDNPDQFITMHWGKRDAPDFSDGKSVFASFAGVWHLSEPSLVAGAGLFRDASPAGSDGLANGLNGNRQGTVGNGALFQDSASIRVQASEALKPKEFLTLSAWVNLTETGIKGSLIANMGDNYTLLATVDGEVEFRVYTDSTYDPNHDPQVDPWTSCTTNEQKLRNSGWRHVAATFDGVTMRIFVDSEQWAIKVVRKPMTYLFGNEFRLRGLSFDNNSAHWNSSAALDEVQVSGIARPQEWIRLQYQNQRPGSTLLRY